MQDGALRRRSTGDHTRKRFELVIRAVMIKDFCFLIKISETSKRFPFCDIILLVD